MKIYYRGYVITEDYPKEECAVEGMRPERRTMAYVNSPQAAMRWIDRDVIRQRVRNAGWLAPKSLAA